MPYRIDHYSRNSIFLVPACPVKICAADPEGVSQGRQPRQSLRLGKNIVWEIQLRQIAHILLLIKTTINQFSF